MNAESRTAVEAKFPAGQYYIGDLCYVMHLEWDEVCGLIIDGSDVKDGEFQLMDGRRFFLASTAYGDGYYNDNIGNRYPVDAGLIGIILVEDIAQSERKNLNLGIVHEFKQSFEVFAENGLFYFGDIVINTRDEEYEEDLCDDDYDLYGDEE